MRMIVTILMALILIGACTPAGGGGSPGTPPRSDDPALLDDADVLRGVNLAGAEFGLYPDRGLPGEYGRDYIYPHDVAGYAAVLDTYAANGVRVIRLPFRWERLQHTLHGPLDGAELARLEGFVQSAWGHGMRVILDLHNYARYCGRLEWSTAPHCGSERLIGKPSVPHSAFADVWRRLADHFSGDRGVYAYSLTNEPTYLDLRDRPLWPQAAQAAVDAIRSVDMDTLVIVPGNGWSAAWDWHEYNRDLWVDDPADKLMYEAHQYFDANNEGTYVGGYDAANAYAEIGVDRVEPFVRWLEQRGARGFIGEFGVPADDSRWLVVLDRFLDYLDEHCLGGTIWAGGPWWGDYPLSVEPVGGQHSPQMQQMFKHPSFECATR